MTGIELIAAERQRQIQVEGWTPEHDDDHVMGEMIGAAVTYAAHALEIISDHEISGADNDGWWPWDEQSWKPSANPIRNLVKAAALLAAEIDRLQRAKEKDVIATITTPITDDIRSILSEAKFIHLSEVGEVTAEDVKAMESQPPNPTLKFDHWSVPKEK